MFCLGHGVCGRLAGYLLWDFHRCTFTFLNGTAFRCQISYRYGVPGSSGPLSLLLSCVLSTMITPIGFLPGVNSLVVFKVRHLREVLSTLITSMGFLSSVNSLVAFKVGHLRELLSTLITSIGFLSSMNSLVFYKARHVMEALSTLFTAVLFWFSQASMFIYCW